MKFVPGSHVRLSNSLYKPSTWLQSSHPYTVASLPEEPILQLVVRKSRYPIKLRQTYSMLGIFRSVSTQFMDDARTGGIRRALFIVGGSGIAFAAPVFRYLESLGVEVKLLWAIRDPQDANVLKSIKLHDAVLDGRVEIYFTRESRLKRRLSTASLLEAQIYKELNDDEYLDIAVDDLCCMDTPQVELDEERQYDQHGYDDYDNNDEENNESGHYEAVDHDHKSSASASDGSESTLSGGEASEMPDGLPSSGSNETDPLLLSRPKFIKYSSEHVIDPIHHPRHPPSNRSKPRYIDIRDEYSYAMFNSRPVLNIRLQAWLCGISIDADDCCCVDQLLQVSQENRRGGWVISAGSHKLVHDSQQWAESKGFKFYQEEFNL
ncbi:Fre8p [Sugiyamaella lignohabitans]|uniref:Fre8p n=1 Tax=Sugiyamaella lignohabitans TaxID=796027 RepID=A0A167FGA4_9ASCO|nr:Fre8p [Sugiyamaella lignohabitans]ANB15263.1 Fre8p [Sugiyamaella lignohabitans]